MPELGSRNSQRRLFGSVVHPGLEPCADGQFDGAGGGVEISEVDRRFAGIGRGFGPGLQVHTGHIEWRGDLPLRAEGIRNAIAPASPGEDAGREQGERRGEAERPGILPRQSEVGSPSLERGGGAGDAQQVQLPETLRHGIAPADGGPVRERRGGPKGHSEIQTTHRRVPVGKSESPDSCNQETREPDARKRQDTHMDPARHQRQQPGERESDGRYQGRNQAARRHGRTAPRKWPSRPGGCVGGAKVERLKPARSRRRGGGCPSNRPLRDPSASPRSRRPPGAPRYCARRPPRSPPGTRKFQPQACPRPPLPCGPRCRE